MALTAADIKMWEVLAEGGYIPSSPRVLEIGQANWYGDIPPPADCLDDCLFEIARLWYKKVLDYRSITAIDMHGKDALKYDLNEPLPIEGQFEIIINTGTAEHVFDQRQLMQSIHDCCAIGGLMIHAAPWQGWHDHGFYCYQPTFFRDLAAANSYEVLYLKPWQFGADSMLYAAMRKTADGPFKVPMQGRYT